MRQGPRRARPCYLHVPLTQGEHLALFRLAAHLGTSMAEAVRRTMLPLARAVPPPAADAGDPPPTMAPKGPQAGA